MSEELFTIEERIELLTENELDAQEVRRILDTCETQPEYWRTVALAFVESQCLRHGFSRLEWTSSVTDMSPQNGSATFTATPPASSPQTPLANSASKLPATASTPFAASSYSRLLFATAACLLLCIGAVGGGMLERGRLGKETEAELAQQPSPSDPSSSDQERQVASASSQTDGRDPQESRGTLADANSVADESQVVGYLKWIGQFGPQSAPVFRGDRVTPEVLDAYPTIVDSRTRQRFQRLGVEVSTKRRLVSLYLNGADYMVAMEDLALLPLTKEVL